MSSKKWTITTISSVSLILLAIVTFNYVIDPYSVFNTFQLEGINTIKNNTISSNMSKFHAAKRANPKVLLIGTSRTEHINPEYLKRYTDGKIYNLGLAGSGIGAQKDNIKYFIEKGEITTIMLGLDFFSFNPINTSDYKTIENTRYTDDHVSDYLDSVLSIRTLRKSIRTLKDNIKGEEPSINYSTGWRNYRDDYIQIEKQGVQFIEKKVVKQLKRYSQKPENFNYPPFKIPESIKKPLQELKEIERLCKNHNVKLFMFISPVYLDITNLIYKRGYGATYEYWKRELSKYGTIFDFSGYNSITTDISNFIDGSHYQTKLASLMFAKIFGDKSVNVPSDFGIILNGKSIDNILYIAKKERVVVK